jgi:hypothetical protein
MLVRAPLVEAEQDGSIRIQDLTEVVMARRRLGLAKERPSGSSEFSVRPVWRLTRGYTESRRPFGCSR